ncbi:MAG: hypothetical protein HN348_28640, partial [Proteobacteria bacterium]|nr:hypothetical protein [Pseudomonadota bacterium]
MTKAALVRAFKGRISRALDHLHHELRNFRGEPLLMAQIRTPRPDPDIPPPWPDRPDLAVFPPPWPVLCPVHPALRGNPTFTTAEWSGALTLPISMGVALGFVEAQQDHLAKHMAEEICSAVTVLIPAKHRDAVLARERVWLEWPWPSTQHGSDPETAGWLLRGLLSRTRSQIDGEPPCFPWAYSHWPDDAATGPVRSWATTRGMADNTKESDFVIENAVPAGTTIAVMSSMDLAIDGTQWN